MGLRKIDDDKGWTGKECHSPEHNPPMGIVLEPGTYEYTCPACGAKRVFTVPKVGFGEMR